MARHTYGPPRSIQLRRANLEILTEAEAMAKKKAKSKRVTDAQIVAACLAVSREWLKPVDLRDIAKAVRLDERATALCDRAVRQRDKR